MRCLMKWREGPQQAKVQDEQEVHDIMSALALSSDIKMVKSRFKAVRDSDDDAVINTAYDGQADYISGDDDLKIKTFEEIRIISVAGMLDLL